MPHVGQRGELVRWAEIEARVQRQHRHRVVGDVGARVDLLAALREHRFGQRAVADQVVLRMREAEVPGQIGGVRAGLGEQLADARRRVVAPAVAVVVVAVDVGVLEEIARGDHSLEGFARDEMVLAAVDLAIARRAGGVRDREPDAAFHAEHGVNEAGLARARGRDHDEEVAGHL